MNSLKILCSLKKSFSTKIITLALPLKRIQRYYFKPKYDLTFNTKTHVDKDTILFKFEKPNFFLALYIFSTLQFITFIYTGAFYYKLLKNPDFTLDPETFWGRVLVKEREHSKFLMPFSLLLVCATFVGSWSYGFRNIRTIILHKGGRQITFVTYGLPGYNTIKVPLTNISSMQHRIKAKKYIPIKIKTNYFYYILDVDGEFLNPVLFDYTVGIKRAV